MELLDGENPARGENSSAGLFFPHPPSYLTANVGFGQCRCVRSYVCTCVTAGRRGVLWCQLPGLGVPLFIREARKLMARMRQASGQATQMLLGHGPAGLAHHMGWINAPAPPDCDVSNPWAVRGL